MTVAAPIQFLTPPFALLPFLAHCANALQNGGVGGDGITASLAYFGTAFGAYALAKLQAHDDPGQLADQR